MAQRQSLPDAGKPTPRDLASLWDGTEIVLSAIAESPLSVRVRALDVGKSDAKHDSALGKAILADLPGGRVDAYLSQHEGAAYTQYTLTDPAVILDSLAEVRAHGYSLDQQEFLPDAYCVGAPIFDVEGRILASTAISMPGQRYHAYKTAFPPLAQEAARAATRNLLILGCAGLSRPL